MIRDGGGAAADAPAQVKAGQLKGARSQASDWMTMAKAKTHERMGESPQAYRIAIRLLTRGSALAKAAPGRRWMKRVTCLGKTSRLANRSRGNLHPDVLGDIEHPLTHSNKPLHRGN
jgi:hypothetical protein